MTVVLYGATGYTGRLVTDELRRRGLDFVLAGRNAERLHALAEERGGGAPTRVASVADAAALSEMLEDASVVVNCAGPFNRAGEPVVAAAVRTGTHYVDSTGEQSFMKLAFDRYGEAAERRGVALVPGMGFDYAPGDCIARLTARGREPLEEITVAYAVKGFGATRGTLRSGLGMMSEAAVVYRDGDWRPAPRNVQRGSFPFPEPVGRRAVSPYPAGEQLTVPRHTGTRKVTTLLTTASASPHPLLEPVVPYALPILGFALRTPLSGVLDKAIGALPEGPDEDARRAARFTIVAVARDLEGRAGRGVVRGTDVYGLTAVLLTHAAEQMASPGYDRVGPLGPAAAFDPEALLNHCGGHGLSWELDTATATA
ncbi:MAG TPA: saccharopine dehydrogenase NADP-binding domain-containing protein [Thermoleophilaceae bacterium]|nr:saccharopine dehydrogenase NADP-binding domain-containing protein [Thermoleophilaceae bacterium]